MASMVLYLLFFVVWIYALHRSVSHSEINVSMNVAVSIHWLQIVFGVAICVIILGSMLMLATENLQYIIVTVSGIFFEWLVIVWIYFQTDWDERAMMYKKFQYMYLQLPVTPKSVLALEKTETGKGNYILYLGLGVLGMVLGIFYSAWIYPVAICGLSIASAMVTSHCRFLQYAAVTQSELIIRYGIPPFRLQKIDLNKMSKAEPQAEKNRIRLTVEDDKNTFTLNLPPESDVARIVASHLTRS